MWSNRILEFFIDAASGSGFSVSEFGISFDLWWAGNLQRATTKYAALVWLSADTNGHLYHVTAESQTTKSEQHADETKALSTKTSLLFTINYILALTHSRQILQQIWWVIRVIASASLKPLLVLVDLKFPRKFLQHTFPTQIQWPGAPSVHFSDFYQLQENCAVSQDMQILEDLVGPSRGNRFMSTSVLGNIVNNMWKTGM